MAVVEPAFRAMMAELHTGTPHPQRARLPAVRSARWSPGAQLNDDATARMDFDLPDADNDQLRALEPASTICIRQDLPLRYTYVPLAEAAAAARPASAAARWRRRRATTALIRIVEIVGLDRQACGGTHLASTARSRPLRILKIDNKGRHNRRIRIGLAG